MAHAAKDGPKGGKGCKKPLVGLLQEYSDDVAAVLTADELAGLQFVTFLKDDTIFSTSEPDATTSRGRDRDGNGTKVGKGPRGGGKGGKGKKSPGGGDDADEGADAASDE